MKKIITLLASMVICASAFAGYNDDVIDVGDNSIVGYDGVRFDVDGDYTDDFRFDSIGLWFNDDGYIRYNTSTNILEFSNDGGDNWSELGSGGGSVFINTVEIEDPDFTDSNDIDFSVATSTITATVNNITMSATGVEQINFDTNNGEPTLAEGEFAYNPTKRTFDAGLGNGVTANLAEEQFKAVKNESGADWNNGAPIMFFGSDGNSGNLIGQLAIADGSLPNEYTIGVLTEACSNGSTCKVTTSGKVRGIQTNGANYGESWNAGDLLYISADTDGYLTKTAPNAPNSAILMAVVLSSHVSNGSLEVRPTWNPKFVDLDDVNGTALTTNGQIAIWDNDSSYFDFTDNINLYYKMNGSAGQTLYFNGTDTLAATSNIYNNNTNIGIGTVNPSTKLHLLNNEDGASVNLLTLDRTSASPADADSYNVVFNHENDNDQQEDFAQIQLRVDDVSDGTEAGSLHVYTADGVDGSLDYVAGFTENKVLRMGDVDVTGSAIGLDVDLNPKQIIHYKMNDNAATTTIVDDEAAFNGTLSAGTSASHTTTGKINSAQNLGTDYISNSYTQSNDFSCTYWFSANSIDNSIVDFHLGFGADDSFYIGGSNFSGKIAIRADGTSDIAVSTWTPTLDTWYFVYVYREGTTVGYSVYNSSGTLEVSNSATGYTLIIDNFTLNTRSGSLPADIKVDDFRLFDDQLTADELTFLVNSGNGTEDNSQSATFQNLFNGIAVTDGTNPYRGVNISANGTDKGWLGVQGKFEAQGAAYMEGTLNVEGATTTAALTASDTIAGTDLDMSADIVTDTDVYADRLFLQETANRSFGLSTRTTVSTIPVPSFRPTSADSAIAVDIMPNGNPSEFGNNGIAWIDVINEDALTGNPGMEGARVGVFDDKVEFGSRVFNSGTAIPLTLTVDSTEYMRIATSGNIGIGTTDPQAQLHTTGGRIKNVTTVNAATYDLLVTDDILHVTYTSTGAVTSLTLPSAQVVEGRVITIKDGGLNAATNNITIDTEGSETIDGFDTVVIDSDGAKLMLYSDGTNWFILEYTVNLQYVGEGSITSGSAITIDTANEWHMLTNISSGDVFKGLTFEAGSTTAITAFADAGGGQVTVTAASHGIDEDDYISITGTTNYNGLYQVTNVATNTFEITATWVSDDATGSARHGTHAIVPNGAKGRYEAIASISATSAAANQTFEFAYAVGTTVTDISRRKFSTSTDVGNSSLVGMFDVGIDSHIAVVVRNITSAGNITINEATFTFKRIE